MSENRTNHGGSMQSPSTSSAGAQLSTVERVLNCQSLPSLPGVAMRVLELTSDRNVSALAIAETIQNDPALTTKVLRTVNSSFYGLSTPCPSIKRATSLLGINTVKSIVLGFSLVETTRKSGLDRSFDMLAYWRRAAYSAAGARAIATAHTRMDPEEAFVGALVQDIGVLAFAATLKREYDAILEFSLPDHERLAEAERKALGTDHAQIGAKLAEKWRLPPQVIDCIRWHHEPARCLPEHEQLLRAVAAGGFAAAVLADTADKRKLGQFVVAMRDWFGTDVGTARDLLAQINESATQLSKSLELKTGDTADLSQIMSQAHEQLLATQEDIERESMELRKSNSELARQNVTDTLTGAYNRGHFDRELRAAFDQANASRSPLTVIFSDADKFKCVNDTHGHQAGDVVLVELSRRLREAMDGIGTVCRYGGEEFAVIVPGADADRGRKVAEVLRRRVCATSFELSSLAPPLRLPITISLGVATHHPGTAAIFANHEQLVNCADQGVYAAKLAGRNCVRVGDPAANGSNAKAPRVAKVLAIEDDALAAKLLTFLFEKHPSFLLTVVPRGDEALARINAPDTRPDIILCDHQLPGMSGMELLKHLQASPATVSIPFVLVSATRDPMLSSGALAAGARLFIDKCELVSQFDKWATGLAEIVSASVPLAAAA